MVAFSAAGTTAWFDAREEMTRPAGIGATLANGWTGRLITNVVMPDAPPVPTRDSANKRPRARSSH